VYSILAFITLGIGSILMFFVWSFFYNGYYTKTLLQDGYEFADSPRLNEEAARALGVSLPPKDEVNSSFSMASSEPQEKVQKVNLKFQNGDKDLANDSYKIYLIKKYSFEFNDVLKKYIFEDRLYGSVDEALAAAHALELASDQSAAVKRIFGEEFVDESSAIEFLISQDIKIERNDRGFKVIDGDLIGYLSSKDLIKYANQRLSKSS
jgi:hypothetical protein